MQVDQDEYEWLVYSEKRAWLIVYVYDAMLHVLRRPFIFLHNYNPSNDEKIFSAVFEEDGHQKSFQVKFKITDYMPHEIEGLVKLAYHSADVWRP